MNSDKIVHLAHPESGCKLAQTMPFQMFHGLCLRTKDICEGCAYNPCPKMEADEKRRTRQNKTNFGKHSFETNVEIAKRLNISPRQVSKMKKRGELQK